MMKLPAFVLICLFILLISSCKKDGLTADATVKYFGDPDADGCGWVIEINNTDSTYSPKDLAVIYQVNNLKVHIAYKKLATTSPCGFGKSLTQIQVEAISKE